eukprot:gene48345-14334_t
MLRAGGGAAGGRPPAGSFIVRLLHHSDLHSSGVNRLRNISAAVEWSLTLRAPLNTTLPVDLSVTLRPMDLRTFVVQPNDPVSVPAAVAAQGTGPTGPPPAQEVRQQDGDSHA